jgi:hypothetical protein
MLTVTLQDRFGNGISGVKLMAHVTGGELEADLTTDSSGKASAEVVWDAPPGQRSASVSTATGLGAAVHG